MIVYVCVKDELCVLGKFVLWGMRIVILKVLWGEVLCFVYEGY